MIKTLKRISLAALATVAAVTTSQATVTTPVTTNILQNISIQFTVYSVSAPATAHNGTVTTKITNSSVITKQLIKALGTDTNITPKPFSSKAFLAFKTPVVPVVSSTTTNWEGGQPVIVVVDGTKVVDVSSDIKTSFTSTPLYGSVVTSADVTTSSSYLGIVSLTVSIPNQWSISAGGLVNLSQQTVTAGKNKKAPKIPVYNQVLHFAGTGLMGDTAIVVDGEATVTYGELLP